MRNFFFARYNNSKKHLANMIVAAAAAAAGLSVGSAQATTINITVPNANLAHYTSSGGNYGSFIPANGDSWTGSHPTSAIISTPYVAGYGTAPFPTVAAYAPAGFPLSQTLTTTWAAGTYVLSAHALTQGGGTLTPTLEDGAAVVGTPTTTTLTDALEGLGGPGILASSTIVVPFGSPDIGNDIGIVFAGTGRPFFDQISLTFTAAVPEPGTVTLLGTGVAGVAFAALRRRWRSKRS